MWRKLSSWLYSISWSNKLDWIGNPFVVIKTSSFCQYCPKLRRRFFKSNQTGSKPFLVVVKSEREWKYFNELLSVANSLQWSRNFSHRNVTMPQNRFVIIVRSPRIFKSLLYRNIADLNKESISFVWLETVEVPISYDYLLNVLKSSLCSAVIKW